MRHGRTNNTALAVATALVLAASAANATTFLETGAIVDFIVPTTGQYAITAWGAAGGDAQAFGTTTLGGLGGELGGDFNLVAGHTLQVLVGEQGASGYYPGGGGGAFVDDQTTSTLIVAAGGGGGANDSSATTNGSVAVGGNAQAGPSGGAGDSTPAGYGAGGAGGTNGGGGAVGISNCCGGGGGGGGFSGNGGGAGYDGHGGASFLNGGGVVAFGGGGQGVTGGSGGGGGYSGGGGGGTNGIGGGGGSYLDSALLVAGTALPFANVYAPADPQTNGGGYPVNSGEVIITQVANASGAVPEPTPWALMLGGLGFTGALLRRRRTASHSGTRALLAEATRA